MSSEKEECQLFTIEEPEYDQSTYQGRFMSFVKVCNPLIAFYTNTRIM